MSPPKSGGPKTSLEIADRIQQRIDQLRLGPAEIKRRGGPSGTSLRDFLRGQPIKRVDVERALAIALEWTPNSIQLIREGQEPVEAGQPKGDDSSSEIMALAERATAIIQELARRASQ